MSDPTLEKSLINAAPMTNVLAKQNICQRIKDPALKRNKILAVGFAKKNFPVSPYFLDTTMIT